MRVSDLIGAPELGIEVHVAGPAGALDRAFTWCVPTESIDPSPFLTPGSLMLTSGMALNVTDVRIWDAYVERLAEVPIVALAFGLGPAHHELPDGLVAACEAHGVPLLVVPPEIPFVLVQRDAQDKLAAERYETLRRGSELAQDCTRLAASGGTLQDVLQRIARDVGGRVVLMDSTGTELLRAGSDGTLPARSEFTLPGAEKDHFRLVVEEESVSPMIRTLLSPVAAVVSMQLSATLGATAVAYSRNAGRLVEAVYTREAIPTQELIALTRDAELEPYEQVGAVVIEVASGMSTTYLRTISWRARVRLATEFAVMRYVEESDLSTVLVQGSGLEQERLLSVVSEAIGSSRSVSAVAAVAANAAELGLTLRLARRSLGPAGVAPAPTLNFDAVVDTLRHPGTVSMARRLLAPLEQEDDPALVRTLDTYLRLSGSTPAVCEALFIHRNTLAYRLKKIGDLLGVDLRDGQVRATLMLALRLHVKQMLPAG